MTSVEDDIHNKIIAEMLNLCTDGCTEQRLIDVIYCFTLDKNTEPVKWLYITIFWRTHYILSHTLVLKCYLATSTGVFELLANGIIIIIIIIIM